MKKLTSLLVLLSIGCTTHFAEINPELSNGQGPQISSKHVSKADVTKFLTGYKELSQTRAGEIRIDPVLYQNDTVMFLINYGEGWDVISADKRAPMVLMQSDTGHTTIDELYDNPGKKINMESMSSTIAALRADPEAKFSLRSSSQSDGISRTTEESREAGEYVSMWAVVAPDDLVSPTTRVELPEVWTCIGVEKISSESAEQPHLMQTMWNQGPPWNYYAPFTDSSMTQQCVTGCVPVAAAQVLYYLRTKKNIPINTYPEVSARNAYIPNNATSMYLNSSQVTITPSYPNSWIWFDMALAGGYELDGALSAKYVSSLMIYLGYRLNAQYRYSVLNGQKYPATSASTSQIPSIFSNYFGIKCTYVDSDFNSDIAKINVLTNKVPIIIHATGYRSESTPISHAFVIDGYKSTATLYKYTYIKSNTIEHEFKYENKWVYENFIQINWGYSGLYDSPWYADTSEWRLDDEDVYNQTRNIIYGFAKQ